MGQGARSSWARWESWLPLLGALLAPVAAAEEPSLVIAFVDRAPEIDGVLDDPVWQQAAILGPLTQVEPVEGAPPTLATSVRIVSDGRALYFGIRCFDDDPSAIIAQKMQRDANVLTDDRISIAIDTFHDRRNGYLFQVNANSARTDGLIENGNLLRSWDAIWEARARIDEAGWVVEIAIPYQSLSFSPSGETWGLNVLRAIRRRDELLRWAAPHQNVSFINMARAGTLKGLVGLSQGLGIRLSPTLVGRVVDDPVAERDYTKLDPGGEIFYKPTPALTATLTANTDFGDTEVDARQVNLSRFALFFPERREFFLQDAGIFGFADNAVNGRPFFSRRIGLAPDGSEVPIRVGGKLTGRVGPLNLGLMDVYVGDYVFDGEDGPERVDKRNLFAGRLSLNVLEESNVGTMVTHGDPGSNGDNTLLGFDFNYQNSHFLGSKVLVGRAWYQRSWTTGLSDDENAYGAVLQYPNDRIRWRLSARTLEENFFPALGFANRTGIRQYDASIRQRIRPKTFIRTVDMRLTGLAVTDTDGQLESAILGLAPFELGSILGDRLEVLYQYTFEHLSDSFEIREGVLIPSGDYPNSRGTLRIVASQSRRVGGLFEVSWGGFFSGTRLRLRPRIDWRPTRHLLLALEFEQNDVELPEGQFTTRIVRGRLEIAFTADLSWNTFVQYDDVTASVGINSRLRWIIRDGRELVLVYNQGVVDDGDRWTRGRTEALAKVVWTFQF